jgi:phosphoserine aminotransferase
MKENGKAAYLDTGTWSAGAIKEPLGETVVVALQKKKITITFQKDIQYRMNYFHCTSNNTIFELK